MKRLALLFAVLPLLAQAALRPQYGGELVLTVPQPVVENLSWKAWNPAEVALAMATTVSLDDLVAPERSTSGELVYRLPPGLAWSDGTALSPKELADALTQGWKEASVSLPPLKITVDKGSLVVAIAPELRDLWTAGPWLRVPRGGAFRPFTWAADPGALNGRSFSDRLRVEVREGRKLESGENGIVLARESLNGRPVFALVRPGAPSGKAVSSALAQLDRGSLARLFLRGFGKVPDGWPLPAADAKAVPAEGTLVIAMDESEHDLRSIAERLQVLLRDRRMPARVLAEKRAAFFARLSAGDYDIALVPLPTAPARVQAATLARLAKGDKAAEEFWRDALKVPANEDATKPLKDVAAKVGAVLLYVEGGGIAKGARVRLGPVTNPWDLDIGGAWLVPAGAAP